MAFDAAEAALSSAGLYLTAAEVLARRTRLAAEHSPTAELLEAFARNSRAHAQRLNRITPRWEARRLLGLPNPVTACIFNLDGVLIGSAAVHAAAWSETFDEFLSRRGERTRGRFAPFNPHTDYPLHIHAKPRLDGVRAFLASRGIRLPEGEPGDPPGAETVHGLANRKNEALLRRLDTHGIAAFESSQQYLALVHDAGMTCAVVSASANTDRILDRAGIASLVDEVVDGNVIRAERLRPRPEPDIHLAACRRLGVDPSSAAVFETSPAGVAAGHAAGFDFVVGVDHAGQADKLRDEGADLVVGGLAEILNPDLAAWL
jgi:beta-phosphoglucomutase-like phosphatase (HAD superfamily)